jgi:hypothetical protein
MDPKPAVWCGAAMRRKRPRMTSDRAPSGATPLPEDHFSLMLGGPLFQIWLRTHLTDDALGHLRQRIAAAVAITWAPLLVLSAVQGALFGGGRSLPFLEDAECHLRLLVSMPLLICAELIVHGRMRPIVDQFRLRGLIPAAQSSRFTEALNQVFRLRNSVVAELILILFVYAVGVTVVWRQYFALHEGTWYATLRHGGYTLSLAGFWFVLVSLPFYQFLLCRWYFRLFIWVQFLWRVSRLDLDLDASHPDKAGGLGFLGASLNAFVPLSAAHGVLLTGVMTNRILFAGEKFLDFKFEVFLLLVFLLVAFAGPLTVFAVRLARLRRKGLAEYGVLGQAYVRAFDAKWIRGGAPAEEPLVGSSDIQSLADLANSFAVIEQMRIVPLSRGALVLFVAAFLIPMLPLTLTVMPMEKLIDALVAMVSPI